jgi:DNA-binding transcriptional LysR family regulator
MITFRQLEIFAAIVRYGSFRRGADELGISPEAVSANIRTLESQIGYPLFERHVGGPATLTGPGERAHQFASNILDDLAYLYDASGRAAPRKIVVGAHPYIMRYLQDGIDAFRVVHPDVAIELDIDSSNALSFPERAERRMVDLGYYFVFDDGHEPFPAFTAPMQREQLAIFVARDHPLAAKQRVSIADLDALPIIQLSHRTSLRPLIDRALTAYGLGGARIGVETDDYGHILTSARRGEGYVCMFASVGEEVGDTNALAMLAMDQPLPSLHIRRASRSLQYGALVTELEALLRATFARQTPI